MMRAVIPAALAALLAGGMASSGLLAQEDGGPEGDAIAIEKEWKGDGSAIESAEQHRITSAGEWKRLWARHTGKPGPPPEVDFTRSMVVALFLPRHGCPPLKIASVTEKDGVVEVRYDYFTGPALRGYRTTAYLLLQIPRKKGRMVLRMRRLAFAHERNPQPTIEVIREFDALEN